MDLLKIQVIPERLGYILSFRAHVCSSEHYSDLSFVYRFLSLLYTSGTLTTYFLCNIEVCTELTLLNENNRSVSVHMYARSNRNWMSVLGASKYARNNHYWAYMRRALKYARSNHYWTYMLGASKYARSNHYLDVHDVHARRIKVCTEQQFLDVYARSIKVCTVQPLLANTLGA